MVSSQAGIHPNLGRIVARHAATVFRGPLHAGSRAAFDAFLRRYSPTSPLILDSGCGTGESTASLARARPDAFVLGVDRSAHRLARAPGPMPDNAMLARARVEDLWRLLIDAGVRPECHYLLYPNPWPKSAHFKRRWHGHPVFPRMLRLADRLELRGNWRLYLDEFRTAADVCGVAAPPVVSFQPESALTPFERKYRASGHDLYRLTINLENQE